MLCAIHRMDFDGTFMTVIEPQSGKTAITVLQEFTKKHRPSPWVHDAVILGRHCFYRVLIHSNSFLICFFCFENVGFA